MKYDCISQSLILKYGSLGNETNISYLRRTEDVKITHRILKNEPFLI